MKELLWNAVNMSSKSGSEAEGWLETWSFSQPVGNGIPSSSFVRLSHIPVGRKFSGRHCWGPVTKWLEFSLFPLASRVSVGKESACNAGDAGSVSGLEDPLEESSPSSKLAWRVPWTKEPGRLHAVHRVAKGQTWLERLSTKQPAIRGDILDWTFL